MGDGGKTHTNNTQRRQATKCHKVCRCVCFCLVAASKNTHPSPRQATHPPARGSHTEPQRSETPSSSPARLSLIDFHHTLSFHVGLCLLPFWPRELHSITSKVLPTHHLHTSHKCTHPHRSSTIFYHPPFSSPPKSCPSTHQSSTAPSHRRKAKPHKHTNIPQGQGHTHTHTAKKKIWHIIQSPSSSFNFSSCQSWRAELLRQGISQNITMISTTAIIINLCMLLVGGGPPFFSLPIHTHTDMVVVVVVAPAKQQR